MMCVGASRDLPFMKPSRDLPLRNCQLPTTKDKTGRQDLQEGGAAGFAFCPATFILHPLSFLLCPPPVAAYLMTVMKQRSIMPEIRIDPRRLLARLEALAQIGEIADGGVSRVALSDADREGRDQLVVWMRDAGLEVRIDRIGNIFGLRPGKEDLPSLMSGSHLDTVTEAGRYDGSYGVLAALEVAETLNDHRIETRHPLAVVSFTNEEGVRYTPDMLGSLVYAGGLPLEEALQIRGFDGSILGEELRRIGYAGAVPCGEIAPAAYVELHIEQGPVLEQQGLTIGAVENLMGICWQEITVRGQANHAGTTPTTLRRDAGLAAAKIVCLLRELALQYGDAQRATCGMLRLEPNAINVIPEKAVLSIDLRYSDPGLFRRAQQQLAAYLETLAAEDGMAVDVRELVNLDPVQFDPGIVTTIWESAKALSYPARRMTSGAGHDAQMMARICPTAMIFVPSRDGISHNPAEFTAPEDLVAGANVLLRTLRKLDGVMLNA